MQGRAEGGQGCQQHPWPQWPLLRWRGPGREPRTALAGPGVMQVAVIQR